MSELSDEELADEARRGSKAAATELFRRHWRPAWRAAYAVTSSRATADDVAQDAFQKGVRCP